MWNEICIIIPLNTDVENKTDLDKYDKKHLKTLRKLFL